MKKLLLLIACAYVMSIHAMGDQAMYMDIQKLLCILPIPAPSDQELQTLIVPSRLTSEQREEIVTTAQKRYDAVSDEYHLQCYPSTHSNYLGQCCQLITRIKEMTNVISSYEEIENFIKDPEYVMFAPRVSIDQLTPEQRTTLAELAETQHDILSELYIEKHKACEKAYKTRPVTEQELKSFNQYLLQTSWKAAELREVMAQINPRYCSLLKFIEDPAIYLPQPSKRKLAKKICSASLTSEQIAKIFAIASKELKARRENSTYLIDCFWGRLRKIKKGNEKGEWSFIVPLRDGRGPREVKIAILEDIIKIVHSYR